MNEYLTLFIAFSAIILGLSVIAQTIQELYKYLTNSKSKTYSKAMTDYMGSLFLKILQSPTVHDLRIKGPFQIFSYRPKSYIQPLDAQTLSKALDSSLLAYWQKRCHDYLKQEVAFQANNSGTLSPNWQNFLSEFGKIPLNTQNYFSAEDVLNFLEQCYHTRTPDEEKKVIGTIEINAEQNIDATQLLQLFESRFLSAKKEYLENYDTFLGNFDFMYKRRNVRQTFIFGILLCALYNLPIQNVYQSAKSMDDETAMALLDKTKSSYEEKNNNSESDSSKKSNSSQDSTIMETTNAEQGYSSDSASAQQNNLNISSDTQQRTSLQSTNAQQSTMSERIADTLQMAQLKAIEDSLVKIKIEFIKNTISSIRESLQTDDVLFDTEKGCSILLNITNFKEWLLYILGCIGTALCLSFGAPIINDLAAAAVSLRTGIKKQ